MFAATGGLMSYGGPLRSQYRPRWALYTDRILKGDKPVDSRCSNPLRSESRINLKDRQGARPSTIPPTLHRPRRRGDRMRAAGVHHAARRRGSGMAARGAGAAVGDAGDRIPQQRTRRNRSRILSPHSIAA